MINRFFVFAVLVLSFLACEEDTPSPAAQIVNGASDRWVLIQVTGGFAGIDTSFTTESSPSHLIFDEEERFEQVSVFEDCSTTGIYNLQENTTNTFDLSFISSNCIFYYGIHQRFILENGQLIGDDQAFDGFRSVYEKRSF